MARKKVRSVFQDLYPEDQAAVMEMRSLLLQGLGSWMAGSGMTQAEAAKVLAVTQARVSDIKRGHPDAGIRRALDEAFVLDSHERLANRATTRAEVLDGLPEAARTVQRSEAAKLGGFLEKIVADIEF